MRVAGACAAVLGVLTVVGAVSVGVLVAPATGALLVAVVLARASADPAQGVGARVGDGPATTRVDPWNDGRDICERRLAPTLARLMDAVDGQDRNETQRLALELENVARDVRARIAAAR